MKIKIMIFLLVGLSCGLFAQPGGYDAKIWGASTEDANSDTEKININVKPAEPGKSNSADLMIKDGNLDKPINSAASLELKTEDKISVEESSSYILKNQIDKDKTEIIEKPKPKNNKKWYIIGGSALILIILCL